MTIRQAKQSGLKKLHAAHDVEAAIDAEILLARALGISREELLAHDERAVPGFILARYRRYLARRARHEPIAYIVGHREFFGLQFEVNKHTLIPRPETELIVEEILAVVNSKNQKPKTKNSLVIDVGTGSGAIAVAVAKNSKASVIATDVSKLALKTAERNAAENGVADRIDFHRADLLEFKMIRSRNFDANVIIVANLPYIPTKDWRKCMPDVKNFEPRTALDGGPDGLRLYDKLFHQIVGLNIEATIICEIDPSQKKTLPALAKKHFPAARVEIKNDLAGLTRIATVSLLRNNK